MVLSIAREKAAPHKMRPPAAILFRSTRPYTELLGFANRRGKIRRDILNGRKFGEGEEISRGRGLIDIERAAGPFSLIEKRPLDGRGLLKEAFLVQFDNK